MGYFQGRFLVALMLGWCLAIATFVDDAEGQEGQRNGQAARTEGDAAATPASDEAGDDFYRVPDTVKELEQFLVKLRDFQPNNAQEFFRHREQAGPALTAAAEKIVKLEKDKSSDAYQMATQILLEVRIQALGEASEEQQRETLEEVLDMLREKEALTRQDFLLGFSLARNLEYSPTAAPEMTARAYESLAEIFSKGKEPAIRQNAEMMQGAARRLKLVGQPMSLEGTRLDGTPFDLESLQGKVVLVDFWATWCGPCIAEFPNIKANYEKYHDQGFEVVGVSIDQDRSALEKYVADKGVPWITLHEKDRNGQHPATIEYGIFGIPAMFLVGRDGRVISTQARGPALRELLEKAFSE